MKHIILLALLIFLSAGCGSFWINGHPGQNVRPAPTDNI